MMKSFKQFLREVLRRRTNPFEPDSIFFFASNDKIANAAAELLCEGGRSYELKKGYHCRFDRAHVPGQQDHLHVYLRDVEACVVNRDGTPSHGTSIELPRHVRDGISGLNLITLKESTEHWIPVEAYIRDQIGKQLLFELLAQSDAMRF